MRPHLALLGSAAILFGLLVAPVAPASAAVSTSAADLLRANPADLMERDVIVLINRVRASKGCVALRTRATLQTAAGRHSALMARTRRLAHQLPGEPALRRRTEIAGYTGARMLGEVLAAGTVTPSGAMKRWLASSGHRALLLDCRFRHVGAGYATSADGTRWWTVDLGRR